MLNIQPPDMLPLSFAASSKTYKDQIPFGADPLKTESAAPYGEAGAGVGRLTLPPPLLGLKVPETTWLDAGKLALAASSKLSVILVTPRVPPTWDITSVLCPAGPANSTFTS